MFKFWCGVVVWHCEVKCCGDFVVVLCCDGVVFCCDGGVVFCCGF